VQQLSVLSKKLRTRMHQSWQERSWTMMSGLTKPQATHNNSFNATPLQHFFHPCLLWPKHSAKNLAQPLGKRPAPKVSRHGLARPPTDYAKESLALGETCLPDIQKRTERQDDDCSRLRRS